MVAAFTLQEEGILCRAKGAVRDTGHRTPCFKLG